MPYPSLWSSLVQSLTVPKYLISTGRNGFPLN
jgi:hypothetical protein